MSETGPSSMPHPVCRANPLVCLDRFKHSHLLTFSGCLEELKNTVLLQCATMFHWVARFPAGKLSLHRLSCWSMGGPSGPSTFLCLSETSLARMEVLAPGLLYLSWRWCELGGGFMVKLAPCPESRFGNEWDPGNVHAERNDW